MRKNSLLIIVIIICISAGEFALAAESIWINNFEVAQNSARKEGKDLMLCFTGSDWCYWCKKLRSEIFDKSDFIGKIQKSFILVEIDFPNDIQQTDELKRQNNALSETYAVEGFPSVILADAAGQPYAKTGYLESGTENYLKHIDTLKQVRNKRDELFSRAQKAEGLARAELIDQALELLAANDIYIGYSNLIEEIKVLDADNRIGLKMKYEVKEIEEKLGAIVEEVSQTYDYEKALAQIDSLIKKVEFNTKIVQTMYLLKAKIYLNFGDDLEIAKNNLIKAYEASPDTATAQKIKGYLAQVSEE